MALVKWITKSRQNQKDFMAQQKLVKTFLHW
jgi:hypothetical protein